MNFEQLYESKRDYIFKYLVKLTQNVSLAEELTSETFFRAYMNFASLKDKEKAVVWLCQIAKSTYYAWYNEQKKLSSLPEIEEIPGCTSLEEHFVNQELSQKALTLLHELEDPYKEVFMLAVLGNFSLKDISHIFRKSESWARVTFYRAKQKLWERMR